MAGAGPSASRGSPQQIGHDITFFQNSVSNAFNLFAVKSVNNYVHACNFITTDYAPYRLQIPLMPPRMNCSDRSVFLAIIHSLIPSLLNSESLLIQIAD